MKFQLVQEKKLVLRAWDEINGTLNDLFRDDHFVYIRISDKLLSFPDDSVEAKVLHERLDSSLIGKKIGILRTDLHVKPIRVRLFD